MSSQITHAQIPNIYPLANIPGTRALIFSNSALSTLYLNSIMQRLQIPNQVKSPRPLEGGPKDIVSKQKWPLGSDAPGSLHFSLSYTHCRSPSTVIPSVPMATFTPSIQPNFSLLHTRPRLTSANVTLLGIRCRHIHSLCTYS